MLSWIFVMVIRIKLTKKNRNGIKPREIRVKQVKPVYSGPEVV